MKTEFLDFSTREARREDGERELQLNRQLAPKVYLGSVPLTFHNDGLHVSGPGQVIDWLVQMRRLPRERMLDHLIESGTVESQDVQHAAVTLAQFYRQASPVNWTGEEYIGRIVQSIYDNERELAETTFELSQDRLRPVIARQREFVESQPSLLKERVAAGHLIEAHGDLRPEHICLKTPPVIIDCLEFQRDLRILDTVSELCFLSLECERLGTAWVGDQFLITYRQLTDDAPPHELLDFYRSWHALTRAKIALWHLHDAEQSQPQKWKHKARHYLELASTPRYAN